LVDFLTSDGKGIKMNKLSKTSKLDNILSWSLQALETCPGSVDSKGELVAACSGCYATTGCYSFKGTKAVRADNKAAWQESDWTNTMIQSLKKQKFFRWFDSGDMYSLSLAEKMLEVMTATPHVQHWLPTRMYKFPKFSAIIAKMQALPNVMVRPSSDAVDGSYTPGVHGSTIIPAGMPVPAGVVACTAPDNGGKCNGCRACYSKEVPVVAYIAHGRKMAKVIRIAAV
jgi:hypothetical protein